MSDYPPKNLRAVRERFLFAPPAPDFFDPFDTWTPRAQAVAEIARALRSNLESAINAGSVPSKLTNSAVIQAEYRRVYTAERIRCLPILDPGEEENEESKRRADIQARQNANQKFGELQKTEEFKRDIISSIIDSLFHALDDAEFASAADELLRQVTVMIWGALEVVATDIAIEVLNQKPSLALSLMSGEFLKRMGGARGIPLEALEEYGFDVSRRMGTILLADRRLDSLPPIATVCRLLYKSEQLDRMLKSKTLHILNQRRHLIVHRRGIVDSLYLSKTPGDAATGTMLTIRTNDIDEYLKGVRDIGLEIIRSADGLVSSA